MAERVGQEGALLGGRPASARHLQGHQLNMALCFSVKIDLSSVRYSTRVHWIREAAKKVIFLVAGPLRGGGG